MLYTVFCTSTLITADSMNQQGGLHRFKRNMECLDEIIEYVSGNAGGKIMVWQDENLWYNKVVL